MAIYVSLGIQNLAVADTAVGFTLPAATVGTTYYAHCVVETASIRHTCDGTAPVATTTGTPRNIGDVFEVWGGPDLVGFKAIRETATSGALATEYFGVKA